jgi:hypothetical protein
MGAVTALSDVTAIDPGIRHPAPLDAAVGEVARTRPGAQVEIAAADEQHRQSARGASPEVPLRVQAISTVRNAGPRTGSEIRNVARFGHIDEWHV